MVKNILLSGVGGQGILLAAKIIATAADLAGCEVTTNEIHGMAQRGGSGTAQIRYGENVYSPLIPDGTADVLASLEEIEAIRYAHFLKKDGLAVVSKQQIIPVTVSVGKAVYPTDVEARLHTLFPNLKYMDFCSRAQKLGDIRMANTIMLGALSNGLDIPPEIWERAIAKCVKPAFVESNTAAFKTGRKA